MNRLPAILLLVLTLGVAAALPPVAAATISVQPDRDDVAVNESFELVFRASGELDDGPDFAPLEQDFEILGQSQSETLRLLGGRSDRDVEWTLSLMPKRAGDIRVPPIAFGADRSPELHLQVRPARDVSANGNSELFIESELDTERTWVRAQVVMTVRIFHSLELRGGALGKPQLSEGDLLVEVLGSDRSYHTQRGDTRYFVIERRYALFPQQAGRLQVMPLDFQGQVLERASRYDPFNRRTRTLRLRTQALPLEVLPIPAEFAGQPWLPARSLQLVEHWTEDPPSLMQGEPTTRTLALIADGLMATQLPELEPPLPADLKQYPDQPRLETQEHDSGVLGTREQKLAVIASQPGEVELPGLSLRWFNTRSGQAETVSLAPRRIQVQAAVAPPGAIEQLLPPQAQLAEAAPETPAPAVDPGPLRLWQALAGGLALGWLLTGLAWWRWRRQAVPASAGGTQATPAPAAALRELRRACQAPAEAAQVEAAILNWARAQWPQQPPRSLGALARRMGAPAAEPLRGLEAERYGRNSKQPWQAGELLDAIETWHRTRPQDDADRAGGQLPPLHPNLG